MNKVAVIGPGLLGGSIALALRQRAETSVAIWARRAEAVEEARAGEFADFVSDDLSQVVGDADLVVLCTPVGTMPALARDLVGSISSRTLVTDVGSVKASVVTELGPIFAKNGRFVGSHPMAGSELSGMKAARADLFSGAVCFVTPDQYSDAEAVCQIRAFWEMLGGEVKQVCAEEHDAMVAMVSHFPHLLAATLVEMIAGRNARAFEFCGPGFRDTTRVASGPPAMWTEILRTNHVEVKKTAEAMVEKLHEIIKLLDFEMPEKAMYDFLTQAKSQRDQLRLPR